MEQAFLQEFLGFRPQLGHGPTSRQLEILSRQAINIQFQTGLVWELRLGTNQIAVFWGLPLPDGRCRYATGLAVRSALSGLELFGILLLERT